MACVVALDRDHGLRSDLASPARTPLVLVRAYALLLKVPGRFCHCSSNGYPGPRDPGLYHSGGYRRLTSPEERRWLALSRPQPYRCPD